MRHNPDTRPGLAVVVNGPAPYRVHLHTRIADEITEYKLHSLFTHSAQTFNWSMDLPDRIHPVQFDQADRSVTDKWYKNLGESLDQAKRIGQYLLDHNVKALILMGYNDLTRIQLVRFCKKHGIKLFLRSDSNIKGDLPGSALKAAIKSRLIRWVINHCDGVMPMGRFGEAYFLKYGATQEQSIWVPYEPDYSIFQNVDPAALDAFKQQHGLAEGRKRILYSGRLVQVKRVDLLLDAFTKLAADRPDWDLVIVGDGVLRDELVARLPDELADRVKWLGFMQMDQLVLAYHACDVMVLPSDYEPWALVINEAVAAGLVVVASDVVGAAAEMIQDRVSGRLFESGNLDHLTECLRDATDTQTFAVYKDKVPTALADWRAKADPVEGIRQALRMVGLM